MKHVVIGALLAMSVVPNGNAEHMVGGKDVHDVFPDPTLAALAAAACTGDFPAIKRSIKGGANVNGVGFQDSTPLMWALSCDNVVGMEALLKAGANPNQLVTRFTPVYAAATRYDPRPLRLLLKYGGDPNAKDELGVTALRKAERVAIAGHGWDNYNGLLKSRSLDVNLADKDGQTVAIDLCRDARFDKLVEILNRGYVYDLKDLGSFVDVVSIRIYNAEQAADLQQVRKMLTDRGVTLRPMPVPTLRLPETSD